MTLDEGEEVEDGRDGGSRGEPWKGVVCVYECVCLKGKAWLRKSAISSICLVRFEP